MTYQELDDAARRIVAKHEISPKDAWPKVLHEVQQLTLDDDDELTLSLHCYQLLFPVGARGR